jgi:hypothetical protein
MDVFVWGRQSHEVCFVAGDDHATSGIFCGGYGMSIGHVFRSSFRCGKYSAY